MLSSRKKRFSRLLYPFAKALEKMHLSPNAVTALGFFLTMLVAPSIILANYILAGILVFAAGFCDVLDGALARMTNRVTALGGFIDSVLDRYSDAIILLAMVFAGLCNVVWGFIALVGSLLVSYSRARVEAYGVKHFVVGFAERPIRLLLLGFALLLESWFPRTVNYSVIALAILTHLTVLQRAISAKDVLTAGNKQAKPRSDRRRS
ncbi:MAG: CDP-alcohol phosphatidyltransferase family protein [Candidatus Atabeyarchaeum deiterrae]